jgi:hypothetical protein
MAIYLTEVFKMQKHKNKMHLFPYTTDLQKGVSKYTYSDAGSITYQKIVTKYGQMWRLIYMRLICKKKISNTTAFCMIAKM